VDLNKFGNKNILILILAFVLAAANIWGYSRDNFAKLGFSFDAVHDEDFKQILGGSQNILDGKGLYQHALAYGQSTTFKEFIADDAPTYPFNPSVAVLAIPLLKIGTENAVRFWKLLNLILIVASAYLATIMFTQATDIKKWASFILMFVIFISGGQIQHALMLGQLDISIVFLLLLSFLLYKKQYYILAGLPIGLAIVFQGLIAAMVIFFIWKRAWKTVWVTLGFAGVITAFSFFVVGWKQLPDSLEVYRSWATGAMLDVPFNQSVRGLLIRAFSTNIYIQPIANLPWLTTLLSILIPAIAGIAWILLVRYRREDQQDEQYGYIEYSFTLLVALLFSPLLDDLHFVWLLLPASAILLFFLNRPLSPRNIFFLVLTFIVVLYLGYPGLNSKIYEGYRELLDTGVLVSRNNLLYTGLYTYGLIALNLIAFLILFLRKPQTGNLLEQLQNRFRNETVQQK
jgi:hypothetical protein